MLNNRQKEAVEHTEGPLLILAGAGAGKTKTIVERIVNIIKKGTDPSEILAVTFTNKAAKEMRERILKRLSEENLIESGETFGYFGQGLPTIKTFHSLGVQILQDEYLAAGVTRRLTIFDDGDSLSTIKDICESDGIDTKMHDPKKIRNTISRLKGDMVDMEDYVKNFPSPFQKIVLSVWKKYEEELKKQKSVDFDDLIKKTYELFKNNSEILNKYQNKWKYIHIDEYQDTNNSQYLLTKILANKHKNICVVGDVDQNIYSWRGANLKNLLRFETDFTNDLYTAKLVTLEQNYRSTKVILDAANEIIKLNKVRKEKNLFTDNTEGEHISVFAGYDDKREAEYITEEISKLLEKGIGGEEIVVLYRNNFQSRVLEQAFLSSGIKYHVLGVKFFDRKEVKDVISYLKLSENRGSVEDLKRALGTPNRKLGKVALTKILSGQINDLSKSQQLSLQKFWEVIDAIDNKKGECMLSDLLRFIIKTSGIEDSLKEKGGEEEMERLGNIYELVTLASEYDTLPPDEALNLFMENSALVSDQDTDTDDRNKVKLMTIHASKGLEFDYVFVVGMELGLFPSDKGADSKRSQEESEEERRIFYVAITRARKKIYLTLAKERTIFGKKGYQLMSPFVEDIPEHLRKEVLDEKLPPKNNWNQFGNYGAPKKKSFFVEDGFEDEPVRFDEKFKKPTTVVHKKKDSDDDNGFEKIVVYF